jgi:nickel/cobalt transporter (NicO) family protein
MSQEISFLLATAALVGFLHTILGPDHYIPFIAMSKARNWAANKTLVITLICGICHVLSSVVIGAIGIAIGVGLHKLEYIESFRGNVAGWIFIAFGLAYFIWGIKKTLRSKPHSHIHFHEDGELHTHNHDHSSAHIHVHGFEKKADITPWVLFTIFIFGPCETLIPILMYPAAKENMFGLILVTSVFTLTTIGTMLGIVFASLKGIQLIPMEKFEKYMHASAGFVILLCGISIQFFSL